MLSLLPQLMPAPQALIRNSRPLELAPAPGKVIGTKSGNVRDYVNHIAHLLHSREPLGDYHVRCELIEKQDRSGLVSAREWGSLALRSALGCAMSITLLVLSVQRGDGFAFFATLLLSSLSTMIGIGSRWTLKLNKRVSDRIVPQDRIVVKYPNGSFRIMICKEDVARELYWHPETCHYRFGEGVYRFISLLGTLFLMVGVVCMGNATLELQIGFGASYLILNAVYWIVAALPPKWFWDTDCYKVKKVLFRGGESNKTFTTALWKAIVITGSVNWVRTGQVAPVNKEWNSWLEMADQKIHYERDDISEEYKFNDSQEHTFPKWDPEGALTQCFDSSLSLPYRHA